MTRRPWLERSGGPAFSTWEQAYRFGRDQLERFAARVASETEAIRTLIAARTETDGVIPGPLKGVLWRQQDLIASKLNPAATVDFRKGLRAFLTLDQDITTLRILPPSVSAGNGVHCTLFLGQDSTGGRDVGGYSSNVEFLSSDPPDISAGVAGQVYALAFYADGTHGVMRCMANGWWAA